MSDIQMEFVPWDEGTTVTAYQRKSELMLDTMPPPMIPAAGTGVVQADRSLAFTGLDPGMYWAIAMIADRCQYVAFDLT